MTHSKLRASLNDYVDRTLPGKLRSEVSAHLSACESCAEEVRELEATVALLRRMPDVEPPPHLASAVMARVRDGEAEPRSLRRSLQQLFQPTLTITATAAVAGIAVYAATGIVLAPPAAVPTEPQIAAVEPAAAPAPAPVARETLTAASAPPLAPETPTAASAPPLAPPAPVRMASNAPSPRAGKALRTQMLRRSRALLRHGHSDEVARTLRGAGHPHSATLATYFEDRAEPDVFLVTSASRTPAR